MMTSSQPKKDTPLPKGKVAVLAFIQLSEAVAITMLFPVVPFLVKGFAEVDATNSSEVCRSLPSSLICLDAVECSSITLFGPCFPLCAVPVHCPYVGLFDRPFTNSALPDIALRLPSSSCYASTTPLQPPQHASH